MNNKVIDFLILFLSLLSFIDFVVIGITVNPIILLLVLPLFGIVSGALKRLKKEFKKDLPFSEKDFNYDYLLDDDEEDLCEIIK